MNGDATHLATAISINDLVIAAEVDAAYDTDPNLVSLATLMTTGDRRGIGP